MSEIVVARLSNAHERVAFNCGKPSLDTFIRTQAGQHTRKDMSRTYVAVREADPRVLSYYTLAASCVRFEEFPLDLTKKLPHHQIPCILLARLAVDDAARGSGLGRTLLFDALRRVLKCSDEIGIHSVHVHALDADAARFYRKFDFTPLPGQDHHLFLTLDAARTGLRV